MGGKESKTQNGIGDFSADELDEVKKIFFELSSQKPKSQQRKTIGKKAIQGIFIENQALGLKIYHWMKALNMNRPINFDVFVSSIELLLREPLEYLISSYPLRNKDKLEIICCISLEKYMVSNEESSKLAVNYLQGQTILNELFNMFFITPIERPKDMPGKMLLDTIFRSPDDIIELKTLCYHLKKQLPFLGRYLKTYLVSKFLNRKASIKIPKLTDESNFLKNWNLPLILLSNSYVQNLNEMQLLYSTAKSGSSFNRLAYALKGYNGPTLFFLKHKETNSQYNQDDEETKVNNNLQNQNTSYIYGGFRKSMWTDDLAYVGESEDYIFSFSPKFRNMYTHNNEGGTNYCYMNSRKIANSKYKVGLGFGGEYFKNYRIWIDEDMENDSYTTPDDKTYEKGYLVDQNINKLNLVNIEIWGLGDENALKNQEQYRALEQTQIENSRKVDRKQFVQSDFDKGIFLEKTFSSAQNKEDR